MYENYMFRFIWCGLVYHSERSDIVQVSSNEELDDKIRKGLKGQMKTCHLTCSYPQSNIESAGKGDPKSCYRGIVNGKELYIPKFYCVYLALFNFIMWNMCKGLHLLISHFHLTSIPIQTEAPRLIIRTTLIDSYTLFLHLWDKEGLSDSGKSYYKNLFPQRNSISNCI